MYTKNETNNENFTNCGIPKLLLDYAILLYVSIVHVKSCTYTCTCMMLLVLIFCA